MKKLLTGLLSFSILLSTTAAYIHASETSTPSDGEHIVEIEDGVFIRYDENAINSGIDLGIPVKVELSVPFEQSRQYNYNSVVSAVMLLNTIGFNYTQEEMADLLEVDNIEINDGKQITELLNNEIIGSKYAFTWQQHDALNRFDLKNHITEALTYGNPVLINTFENSGDCYIEGHDQYGALYQYGVVKDYFNFGDAITYMESQYGLYSGFFQSKKATFTSLSYAIGGQWYVW